MHCRTGGADRLFSFTGRGNDNERRKTKEGRKE